LTFSKTSLCLIYFGICEMITQNTTISLKISIWWYFAGRVAYPIQKKYYPFADIIISGMLLIFRNSPFNLFFRTGSANSILYSPDKVTHSF